MVYSELMPSDRILWGVRWQLQNSYEKLPLTYCQLGLASPAVSQND